VVSLLMDTSSEMIHGLLPVFLMGTLGASATLVGLLDGAAEATAAAMKLVSGVISDRVGRRKPLLLLGYGLAALTKPVFALADTVAQILAARVVDRVGKGIRGTPRDALIADITPADRRGAAYGLRQSLDTVGALAGPLVALLLLAAGGDVRLVFAVAVAPAALAVAVLALGVSEPPPREPHRPRPFPIRRAELGRLPACYWGTVGLAVALTFARLSEAFLVLASTRAGWTTAESPWVLVAMTLCLSGQATGPSVHRRQSPGHWLVVGGMGAKPPGAWAAQSGLRVEREARTVGFASHHWGPGGRPPGVDPERAGMNRSAGAKSRRSYGRGEAVVA
jgi:MFS family permease